MRPIFGVAAGMLAAAGLTACMPATEAKEERPAYELARAKEGVEVRDYGARLVAEHSVRGPCRRAVEQGHVLREQAARLDARGIAHRGDFTLASYDPPWKPTAWRSNEVLVTLR